MFWREELSFRVTPKSGPIRQMDTLLDASRAIVAGAKQHLVAGGWLLFEHGFDQAERCRSLLGIYGYAGIASWPDLAGITRVAGARAP